METILKSIIDQIRRCQSFLITSHVRPDGDAIGSELALYHILCSMGKEVVVYNQDATPSTYRFLPGSEIITNILNDTKAFEAAFLLDCSELGRVGKEAERMGNIPVLINIDHHISNKSFCKIAWNDASSSSTGEMIYRLADALDITITENIAVNLYAAILTDTGSFRYSNTEEQTLSIAAKLVGKGVNPYTIAEKIYETVPVKKVLLLSKALDTLEFDWQGRISSIVVTQKMMAEVEALPEHTDNFTDFVRAIEGVEVGIYYTELSERWYKISLRSKGKINVEKIASTFGGGGHANAAACRLEGDLDSIKKKIHQAIMANGI